MHLVGKKKGGVGVQSLHAAITWG